MSEHDTGDLPEMILEAPPVSELSPGAMLEMGPEVNFLLASKVTALDGLLTLTVREHSFDEFMREILLLVMKVVRCEAGSIFEFDHDNQCLFFRSAVGQVSDTITQFTVPAGKGIVGHVAESRQPMLIDEVGENQVHLKSIGDAVGFEARNLVAFPIVIRGRTFGVLELLNRVGEKTFNPTDMELLGFFCESASKAIETRLMIGWAMQRKAAA